MLIAHLCGRQCALWTEQIPCLHGAYLQWTINSLCTDKYIKWCQIVISAKKKKSLKIGVTGVSGTGPGGLLPGNGKQAMWVCRGSFQPKGPDHRGAWGAPEKQGAQCDSSSVSRGGRRNEVGAGAGPCPLMDSGLCGGPWEGWQQEPHAPHPPRVPAVTLLGSQWSLRVLVPHPRRAEKSPTLHTTGDHLCGHLIERKLEFSFLCVEISKHTQYNSLMDLKLPSTSFNNYPHDRPSFISTSDLPPTTVPHVGASLKDTNSIL